MCGRGCHSCDSPALQRCDGGNVTGQLTTGLCLPRSCSHRPGQPDPACARPRGRDQWCFPGCWDRTGCSDPLQVPWVRLAPFLLFRWGKAPWRMCLALVVLRHKEYKTKKCQACKLPVVQNAALSYNTSVRKNTVASGQAVRRLSLEQEIEGSNPSSPARLFGIILQIENRPFWFDFLFLEQPAI